MQEKTGRVELGKTCDENGRPCVKTDGDGEPQTERKTDTRPMSELVKQAANLQKIL